MTQPARPTERIPVQDYLDHASRLLETARNTSETIHEMTGLLVPTVADWCVVWSITQSIWQPLAFAHLQKEKDETLSKYAAYVANSEAQDHEHRVVAQGRPKAIMEITEDTLKSQLGGDEGYRRLIRDLAPKSLMTFPFIARRQVVGVMTMASTHPENRYTDADLDTARRLTHVFALALDNAQLFGRANRTQERLVLAYRITARLLEHPSLEQVGADLLHGLGEGLGWDMGALWTYDHNLKCENLWRSARLDQRQYDKTRLSPAFAEGKGLEERIISHRKSEWLADLKKTDLTNFIRGQVAKEGGFSSALFLPILTPAASVGVIELFGLQPKPKDDDEQSALALLSNQVGAVISLEGEVLKLSTPVLQVQERLLLLPLLGALDAKRMSRLSEILLGAIRERRAKAVVVDITGLPTLNADIVGTLLRTFQACQLLGATVIVTGITPGSARSLVESGVDMTPVLTAGDLQSGIETARDLVEGLTPLTPSQILPAASPSTRPGD